MKTYKDTTMYLEYRAKRYETIKEIVMHMTQSEARTWTDDDIYRLFLIDDKELEEILEFFIQQRSYENKK